MMAEHSKPLFLSLTAALFLSSAGPSLGQGLSFDIDQGRPMPPMPEPVAPMPRTPTALAEQEQLPACPVDLIRDAYALATTGFHAVDLMVIEQEILAACTRNRTALLTVLQQELELGEIWKELLVSQGYTLGDGTETANAATNPNSSSANPAAEPQQGGSAALSSSEAGALNIEALASILGEALGVDPATLAGALRNQGAGTSEGASDADTGTGERAQGSQSPSCPTPRPSDNFWRDVAFINQVDAFDRPPVGTPMASMVQADSWDPRYRSFETRFLVVEGDFLGAPSIEEGGVEIVEIIPYQPWDGIEPQVTLRDCAGERIAGERVVPPLPASIRNRHPDDFAFRSESDCQPGDEVCVFDRDPYARWEYPVEEE